MLMICGGYKAFVDRKGLDGDALVSTLGLDDYAEKEIKPADAIRLLKQMHADAEKQEYCYPPVLQENLQYVLDRISLIKVEVDLLAFSILLYTDPGMESCSFKLGRSHTPSFTRSLAKILGYPHRDVAEALSCHGKLALSGLLELSDTWTRDWINKINLMSNIASNMLVPGIESSKLFSGCFFIGSEPRLTSKDFGHIQMQYSLMKSYLEQAIQKTSGVNFLIYGQPGVGKTELVRSLVKELGSTLYEISLVGDDKPFRGSNRFASYQLSQQLLVHTPDAVIMFDEIEDVFPESGSHGSQRDNDSMVKKGLINNLLETNSVPAFWLSNTIKQIDPAFLRRFDYVLEMPAPTRQIREQIFVDYLDGVTVRSEWITKTCANRHLLPAHIEKAAKVARHIATDQAHENERILDNVLEGTQTALGILNDHAMPICATTYSLDYISANVDIEMLIDGLKQNGTGNICFYGPPGTGKTALGQYISEQLGKSLMVKRASDILSRWVGDSEKNIAAMFRDAAKENAILLLDEADSFLRDRRGARQPWEVTLVNEVLVQMELFEGLFICSTNLMDELDQASLRRFAIKVEFDYLTPTQAYNLLQQECGGEISDYDRERIALINNLVPGDVATVKQRLKMLGLKPTADAMIRELKLELGIKAQRLSRPIGFVQ